MIIKKIEFKNYRNLKDGFVEFSDGTNVITGDNAQGKTNLLEAVWLFSSCKSFRENDDKNFINSDRDFCEIAAEYEKNGMESISKMKFYRSKRKEIIKNDYKIKPAEQIGSFNTVLFYPEQLFLIKGAPEQRRKFLDFAISQLKGKYIENLSACHKILMQKNKILSTNTDMYDSLDEWNIHLAKVSSYITYMRNNYLKQIEPFVKQVINDISSNTETIEFEFLPSGFSDGGLPDSLDEIRERLLIKLNSLKEAEMQAKHALVGCQRDDFNVYLNGKNAKNFASQGQQRSCVIAMKLAEADFINLINKEYPIMLFDDVFSELDKNRKEYLLSCIKDRQVILTCCEPIDELKNNANILTVKDGVIGNVY